MFGSVCSSMCMQQTAQDILDFFIADYIPVWLSTIFLYDYIATFLYYYTTTLLYDYITDNTTRFL